MSVQTEMDRIVKLLQKKGLTAEELSDMGLALARLRKEAAQETKEKKEMPKLILNDRAATIVWPNGLSLAFNTDAEVTCAYDGKKVDPGDQKIEIEYSVLRECYSHICKLFYKRIEEQYEGRKKAMDELYAQKPVDKIRWFKKNSDNKRAFLAGMILGRKRDE